MLLGKTYSSITAGLSKMVTDLESLISNQQTLNVKDEQKKVEIDRMIGERNTEITKSQKTAAKIRDLVEV